MRNWLLDLYSKHNYWFISGHDSFSKKLGLSENEDVSIRFIANKKGIYCYLLTVGCSEFDEVKNKLSKSLALKITKKFDVIFNREFYIILYDKNARLFSVTDDFSVYKDMDSKGLEKYFKEININLVKNKGTFKQINRSINDNFQVWGRKHLSKYMVIADIDILSINPLIFIELKGVKEDLRTWRPYLDDVSNFRCEMNICKSNNISWFLIAYHFNFDEKIEDEIAIHILTELNDDYILGRKTLIDPQHIAIEKGIFDIPEGIGEYKSTNRRQRSD